MANRVFPVSAALLVSALIAGPAYAETSDKLDHNYFAAKLTLGFGGSSSSETGSGTFKVDQDSGMALAFGVAGQYMVPLHDYFALGGMLGVTSWISSAGSDADASRNLNFDLAAVPQGKYALLDNLELYLSVPIGLTIDILNEVNLRNQLFVGSANVGGTLQGNTAVGFMIGVFVGARYLLTDSFGLLAEFGYTHHAVGHSVEASAMLGMTRTSANVDVSMSWGQLGLNLGAFF